MAMEFLSIAEFLWNVVSELVKGHGTQKKEFFQNHIEPLQDRVLRIHQDYIAGFEEVRRLIKDDSKPSEEIIEFLLERRREYDSQRQLSRHMAEEIEKAKKLPIDKKLLEAVSNYCDSIVEYFNASASIAGVSWYTEFIDNVRFQSSLRTVDVVWKGSGISGNPRSDLLESVDIVLDKFLPMAFDKVSAMYAALRAQLL
jgi:hypothetical protein